MFELNVVLFFVLLYFFVYISVFKITTSFSYRSITIVLIQRIALNLDRQIRFFFAYAVWYWLCVFNEKSSVASMSLPSFSIAERNNNNNNILQRNSTVLTEHTGRWARRRGWKRIISWISVKSIPKTLTCILYTAYSVRNPSENTKTLLLFLVTIAS